MVTKGVASVRSPVQNLQRFNPAITHEGFVEASVRAFQEAFGIYEEVRFVSFCCSCRADRPSDLRRQPHYVEETENILNIPEIRKGIEELGVRFSRREYPIPTAHSAMIELGLVIRANSRIHIHRIQTI